MAGKRNRFSPEFKAKVTLEALKEQKTLAELASEHQVHPTQISTWKKQAQDKMPNLFGKETTSKTKASEDELFQQIGQLQVELTWLKKKIDRADARRKA